MTVAFESLCHLAADDDDTTNLVLQSIQETENRVLQLIHSKTDNTGETSAPDVGQQSVASHSVDNASSVGAGLPTPPVHEGGTDTVGVGGLTTPSSTNQSRTAANTNNILDPPIKKKRGRPQTTRHLSAGEKGWPKSGKDDCPTVSAKTKGAKPNGSGKGKKKTKLTQPTTLNLQVQPYMYGFVC